MKKSKIIIIIFLIIYIISLINYIIILENKTPEKIDPEKIKNVQVFYNEFNNNYIIQLEYNNNNYIYIVNDLKYINEYEDIKQYNLYNFIELDQEQTETLKGLE